MHHLIDGGVNLKVWELTGTWGAVGIEMPKFEAKREILQKFGKNWGGGGGGGSAAHASCILLKTG